MEIRFFQESNEAYGNVEDVVKDLNLTFIARNMAHDNYGDVTYILEFLKHPLVTEEEIAQRQKVVMAACDNTPFIYELRKVIVQTWEELQQSLKAVQDTRGKHGTDRDWHSGGKHTQSGYRPEKDSPSIAKA